MLNPAAPKEGIMVGQSSARTVALITGANKRIGLEIARQLGRQGITVLLGAREERRGQEAADWNW
jgi:NAD(P)-dependent dehydrogenase (short-subunit alcohol dehydrogenase family)